MFMSVLYGIILKDANITFLAWIGNVNKLTDIVMVNLLLRKYVFAKHLSTVK